MGHSSVLCAAAWVSSVVRQIGQDVITFALLFRGDSPLMAAPPQRACPRCGWAPPSRRRRRGAILSCVQLRSAPSITLFCDPLKLAKNIPPPSRDTSGDTIPTAAAAAAAAD